MFSSLTKLADKSFVLGFFLPSLLGSCAFVGLNSDVQPFNRLVEASILDKTFANLTAILVVVWTLSVLLMTGSHWMYRVLEGYSWPLNRPGLKAREEERYDQLSKYTLDAYDAMTKAQADARNPTLAPEKLEMAKRSLDDREWDYLHLRWRGALNFPANPRLVLPTRFGNVLRAFEMYPGEVYGVESIHAWPRLLAVIPRDYQATLADARAPVDFFVSLVFISFMLGLIALMRGAAAMLGKPVDAMPCWVFFCIACAAFISVRACYLAALSTAVGWGEVVKSAFDLYLPALARAMGYQLPTTARERRRLWGAFANQFQCHVPVQPEAWEASDPEAAAEPSPKNDRGEADDRVLDDNVKEADD